MYTFAVFLAENNNYAFVAVKVAHRILLVIFYG